MGRKEQMYISLTGEKSHKVTIPLGQGSFSIGTKGVSKGNYDVWVEKDCSERMYRNSEAVVLS